MSKYLPLIILTGMILAACGTPQTSTAPTAAPALTPMTEPMTGMDHGGSDMAAGDRYDAEFIDSMIIHHQGAIAMATEALAQAERPELQTLATAIIAAQKAEIAQMQQWRKTWYPDLPVTPGMGMDMGSMMISTDTSKPFDLRFIEAMIPHHAGAIMMAKDAQQQTKRPEIRQLADAISSTQQTEIAQMQQWKMDWFGQK